MENNHSFSTSFIPKKPMISTKRNFSASHSFDFMSFISSFTIIIIILMAVGLYVYKLSLNKDIQSKSNSLAIIRQNLEEGTLLELQSFNRRLNASNEILSNHTVISPFFALLEEVTLPEVQFISFSGVFSEKGLAVTMGGLGKDYRTVAIQSDILNSKKAEHFKDVVFSDLKLSNEKDSKGFVSFQVSFFVDKSFLSFENNVLKYKNEKNDIFTENQLNIKETTIKNDEEEIGQVNLPVNKSKVQ